MRALLLGLLAASAFAQTEPGLAGSFSDGIRQVQIGAPSPNFYLDAEESIHPSLKPAFRGEWSATLQILENAAYEFNLDVTIDGRTARSHTLSPGPHAFAVAVERRAGVSAMRLEWRSARFDWEPVPRSAFSRPKLDNTIERGRLAIHSAGCGNCHPAAAMERRVPSLAGIGSRTNPNWLYHWISRHQFIPHTAAQSADIAAFLAESKGPQAKQRRANEVAIGKGGELFGTFGCVACHGTLNGLGSKYTLATLTNHLLLTHEPSMLLNDDDATALAAYLTRSTNPEFERQAPPGDPARGKQALDALGCLGCHEQRKQARPLASLRDTRCPQTAIPLNDAAAARAFLQSPPRISPAPVYDFAFELEKHRCLACHKTGSEAPTLEGAGEKLKTSWIEGVLWRKNRIRPGRELRMPHYSQSSMQPWVTSFAKVEGLPPGDGIAPPSFSAELRSAGNGMLGTNPARKGMACIGCHDWGEFKSLGEEGPQLINATERMRFEWFERWMRNPARILSGTSMPNYFGSLPRDRAMASIHALWAGMALGPKAPVPDGYRVADLGASAESKPVPEKEAIVLRWDMPEATPAAIAVGLPGGLSYCFDAGQVRLLYAWKGGFLDMSGTLLRKVDKNKMTPTATLVGEVFWRSAGFPILIGSDKRVPQKRFRGYRLTGGLPEFHYQLDGIDVYEKVATSAGTLVRELRFSRVDSPIWFEGQPVPLGSNVKMTARLGQ